MAPTSKQNWKIALRSFTLLFNIIILSISISNAVSSNSWAIIATGPVAGVSTLWAVAELITFCVSKRGIHPGAHVGLDLLLWLGFATCIGMIGTFDIVLWVDDWESYNSDTGYYNSWYDNRGTTRYKSSVAIIVFATLNMLLHFALFVWACVDTHRRNTEPRAPINKI